MLKLENVSASTNDADSVLTNINLEVKPGEIHAILGPRGSGKSTLAHLIQGNQGIKITQGSITYSKKNIEKLPAWKRNRLGIFTTFQYPPELEGLTNINLVRASVEAKAGNPWTNTVEEAYKGLLKTVGLDSHFFEAGVNTPQQPHEDWKKNEIVQLLMNRPRIGIVDAVDQGADEDTLQYLILMLKNFIETDDKVSLIVISNNTKFLDELSPTHVHALVEGKITESGGKELYKRIITDGNSQFS